MTNGKQNSDKPKNIVFAKKNRKAFYIFLAVIFWIAVWQVAAVIAGTAVILPSPLSVAKALAELGATKTFWLSLWNSFYRIALGFFAALLFAVLLAVLSYKTEIAKTLLYPLMSFLKAVPVVSFIMLLFIFMRNRSLLPSVIAFMMVLPLIYTSVLTGLENTDKKLLEMAEIYRVTVKKRALYIYGSNVMPFFTAGCKTALGLAWKSGVAAEVIALVNDTIGINMETSRTYLHTSELFAWTAVIVALSVGFEKLFLFVLNRIKKKIET